MAPKSSFWTSPMLRQGYCNSYQFKVKNLRKNWLWCFSCHYKKKILLVYKQINTPRITHAVCLNDVSILKMRNGCPCAVVDHDDTAHGDLLLLLLHHLLLAALLPVPEHNNMNTLLWKHIYTYICTRTYPWLQKITWKYWFNTNSKEQ